MPEAISSRRRQDLRSRAFVWTASLVAVAAMATGVAQVSSEPDMVTRKARFRGGADPNVKPGAEVNVRKRPSDVVPPRAPSSAPAPRCAVTFDNRTDLITKTYIDGGYAGTIRPFGELSATSIAGSTVLYARAEYDDGSADVWGPIRVSCRTTYLWRLAD